MDIHQKWFFFEIGHGKGEHDGVGASIKRVLRRHQLNHFDARFVNSLDVVDWCKHNLNHEFNEIMVCMRRYENVSPTLNFFIH